MYRSVSAACAWFNNSNSSKYHWRILNSGNGWGITKKVKHAQVIRNHVLENMYTICHLQWHKNCCKWKTGWKKVVILFRNTVVIQTSLPSPIKTLSTNIHDLSSQPCQLQNSKLNNIQWQLTWPGHGTPFTLPDLPSQHLRFRFGL